MAETQHKVQRKDVQSGRTTTVFEGNETDARNYVHNNFPRPHVEPGSVADRLRADVQLVTPEGTRHEYHGDAGWVDIDGDDQIVGGDVDTDNDPDLEEVE